VESRKFPGLGNLKMSTDGSSFILFIRIYY
jgi:hypothetical protein